MSLVGPLELSHAHSQVRIEIEIILNTIIFFKMLDLDGRWSSWSITTSGLCTTKRRQCNSPAKCGNGADCKPYGLEVIRAGCESNILFSKEHDKINILLGMKVKMMDNGVFGRVGVLAQNLVEVDLKEGRDCVTIHHQHLVE